MKHLVTSTLVFGTLLASGAAHAAGGEFSSAGQIVISSDLQLGLASTSFSAPDGAADIDSVTTIVIAPAMDYFVIDHLSVGGQLVYASTSQGDNSSTGFGIGPRVGFGMAFTPNVSFFPRLSFVYTSTSTDPGDGSSSSTSLSLFAPIQVHPIEHFFIGLGPIFDLELSAKTNDTDDYKSTTIGLASVVGGYF